MDVALGILTYAAWKRWLAHDQRIAFRLYVAKVYDIPPRFLRP